MAQKFDDRGKQRAVCDHGPGDLLSLSVFDDAIQCVRAQTSGVAGRELLQNIGRRNAPGPAQMIIEDQGRHGLDVLFPGRFREKGSVDDLHPEFITCPGQ